MTKYFDQRMYSAGHHDMKHLIDGDKTIAKSAAGFLDYTNAKLFHLLLLQILPFSVLLTSLFYDLLCLFLHQYVQNVQARVSRL
jgi:hypothetical protein